MKRMLFCIFVFAFPGLLRRKLGQHSRAPSSACA